MATYYVDNAGNDTLAGTSPATAWQHCSKVNSSTFAADDQVIFTAGQTFTGPLTITNSGTSGHYICIGTGRLTGSTASVDVSTWGNPLFSSHAQSNPATITCPDGSNGVNANDCQYVSIDNLNITGSGVNTSTGVTTSTGTGISLASTQTTNKLNGMRVTACSVTGCKDGIIAFTANVSHKGYAGLQVWGCTANANGKIGILVWNSPFATGSKTQNSDVYVGYCQTYDLPGSPGSPAGHGYCGEGITIRNCTTGTVEYCTAYNVNIVGDQSAIFGGGTSGFEAGPLADGITFQFCEGFNVYARQTSADPIDGVGLDFETGADNCLAQYCYFHDCDGAGYLTGSGVSGMTATGNVVRFCVFARNAGNNQSELYSFGSQASDIISTNFYCNTVYATNGNAFDCSHGNNQFDGLENNILVSAAGAFCINGPVIAAQLYGNLYYAIGGGGIKVKPSVTTYTTLAGLHGASYEMSGGNPYGVNEDPQLRSPTLGVSVGSLPGQLVATMRYFDPSFQSPAKTTSGYGVDISGLVTLVQDFHGTSCSGHGANIGAVIPQAVNARLPMRVSA